MPKKKKDKGDETGSPTTCARCGTRRENRDALSPPRSSRRRPTGSPFFQDTATSGIYRRSFIGKKTINIGKILLTPLCAGNEKTGFSSPRVFIAGVRQTLRQRRYRRGFFLRRYICRGWTNRRCICDGSVSIGLSFFFPPPLCKGGKKEIGNIRSSKGRGRTTNQRVKIVRKHAPWTTCRQRYCG